MYKQFVPLENYLLNMMELMRICKSINEHLGKKSTILLRINYAQCAPFENYLMIMMEPIIMEHLFHETNIGEILSYDYDGTHEYLYQEMDVYCVKHLMIMMCM